MPKQLQAVIYVTYEVVLLFLYISITLEIMITVVV
jgi:hypothetical protein